MEMSDLLCFWETDFLEQLTVNQTAKKTLCVCVCVICDSENVDFRPLISNFHVYNIPAFRRNILLPSSGYCLFVEETVNLSWGALVSLSRLYRVVGIICFNIIRWSTSRLYRSRIINPWFAGVFCTTRVFVLQCCVSCMKNSYGIPKGILWCCHKYLAIICLKQMLVNPSNRNYKEWVKYSSSVCFC